MTPCSVNFPAMTKVRRTCGAAAAALGLLAGGLIGLPPAYAATGCHSGVAGDANGDGYAEVAVGSPGQRAGRGAVNVFYGQASGLVADQSGSAPGDFYLTQDTSGVPGTPEKGDYFGSATAFGDFNSDGCADLAIGAPGNDRAHGAVTIIYGSPAGLSTAHSVRFEASAVTANREASLGSSVATGDLNGDGVDDLAVGMPGLKVGRSEGAGGVAVFYGSRHGLNEELGPKVVTQASPGVPGRARTRDNIGTSLAIGNVDGQGFNELVIGSSEDHNFAGSVQVIKSTKHGFATSGQAAPISDDTPGLKSASLNEFGTSIALGDVNGDGFADVAVGSPESFAHHDNGSNDNGAVFVLLGSANGLTTQGVKTFSGDVKGVPGDSTSGGFGMAVSVADLNSDGTDDVAIGVPSTSVGNVSYAGAVTVLFGGSKGITTTGARSFDELTPGIAGDPSDYGRLGATLTTAQARGSGKTSLVIGAPSRSLGSFNNVGAIWELPSGSSGPQGTASRMFTADTPGVQGAAGADTNFGGSLSSY